MLEVAELEFSSVWFPAKSMLLWMVLNPWEEWDCLIRQCEKSESRSIVSDSATPWTEAPLSMEFSRPEYWSRSPFPSPGVQCRCKNKGIWVLGHSSLESSRREGKAYSEIWERTTEVGNGERMLQWKSREESIFNWERGVNCAAVRERVRGRPRSNH